MPAHPPSAVLQEEFTREAEIMTLLEHSNIVKIVGAAMVFRPWLVVLEMMQYGDLKKVMLVSCGCALHCAVPAL